MRSISYCSFAVAIMAAATAALSGEETASASIQGTVTAEDGKPIADAWIVASRRSLAVPSLAQSARSSRDGTFTVANLAAGTYRLCIQAPGTVYLDPCHWSTKQTDVTLTSGQKVTGQQLRAAKGSFARVRVNDPNQRISTLEKSGKPVPLLIGVWTTNGMFLPMIKSAEDAAGKNYQVLVPPDTKLRMAVTGGSLDLEDGKHDRIPTGGAASDFQKGSQDDPHQSTVFHIK